jgi:hypothetical protein
MCIPGWRLLAVLTPNIVLLRVRNVPISAPYDTNLSVSFGEIRRSNSMSQRQSTRVAGTLSDCMRSLCVIRCIRKVSLSIVQ